MFFEFSPLFFLLSLLCFRVGNLDGGTRPIRTKSFASWLFQCCLSFFSHSNFWHLSEPTIFPQLRNQVRHKPLSGHLEIDEAVEGKVLLMLSKLMRAVPVAMSFRVPFPSYTLYFFALQDGTLFVYEATKNVLEFSG